MPNPYATQPENVNFLSQLGLRFQISNKPHLNYFIQKATLPGINLGVAPQHTPFAQIPWAGDLEFNELTIEFKVDEELENYIELWNWMVGLGFPENFDQYKSLINSTDVYNPGIGETQVDGTLLVFGNQMVPKFQVTFLYLFPTMLSDLQLNSTDADVTYVTCTANFKFMVYNITRIPTSGNLRCPI